MTQLPNGFGWVILVAFLFMNLIWVLEMIVTPPPYTMKRKRAPRHNKPTFKKMARRSPLPLIRLQRPSVSEPAAQPVP